MGKQSSAGTWSVIDGKSRANALFLLFAASRHQVSSLRRKYNINIRLFQKNDKKQAKKVIFYNIRTAEKQWAAIEILGVHHFQHLDTSPIVSKVLTIGLRWGAHKTYWNALTVQRCKLGRFKIGSSLIRQPSWLLPDLRDGYHLEVCHNSKARTITALRAGN